MTCCKGNTFDSELCCSANEAVDVNTPFFGAPVRAAAITRAQRLFEMVSNDTAKAVRERPRAGLCLTAIRCPGVSPHNRGRRSTAHALVVRLGPARNDTFAEIMTLTCHRP